MLQYLHFLLFPPFSHPMKTIFLAVAARVSGSNGFSEACPHPAQTASTRQRSAISTISITGVFVQQGDIERERERESKRGAATTGWQNKFKNAPKCTRCTCEKTEQLKPQLRCSPTTQARQPWRSRRISGTLSRQQCWHVYAFLVPLPVDYCNLQYDMSVRHHRGKLASARDKGLRVCLLEPGAREGGRRS